MGAVLWPILSWLLRDVVIRFITFSAAFAIVGLLVPKIVEWITPFIGVEGLTSAFTALPSSLWYFLDIFGLDYGLPLLISANVASFLIRRLSLVR